MWRGLPACPEASGVPARLLHRQWPCDALPSNVTILHWYYPIHPTSFIDVNRKEAGPNRGQLVEPSWPTSAAASRLLACCLGPSPRSDPQDGVPGGCPSHMRHNLVQSDPLRPSCGRACEFVSSRNKSSQKVLTDKNKGLTDIKNTPGEGGERRQGRRSARGKKL
jgi:hypothetical protein